MCVEHEYLKWATAKILFLALNQEDIIRSEWVSEWDEIVAEGKNDIWSVSEFNIMMIAHPCINPTEDKRALKFIFRESGNFIFFMCAEVVSIE